MNESECCECRCTCYIEKGDNKLSKFDISVVHYKQKGVDRFKDRMHTLISHSNSNRNIIEHILFPQQQSGTKIGKKVKEAETDGGKETWSTFRKGSNETTTHNPMTNCSSPDAAQAANYNLSLSIWWYIRNIGNILRKQGSLPPQSSQDDIPFSTSQSLKISCFIPTIIIIIIAIGPSGF